MNIEGMKKPLQAADMERVEKRLGTRFPEDYRKFLLKFNGGHPEPCSFRFKGADGFENESLIGRFYAIHDEKDDNFETTHTFFKNNGRIPPNVAPIAYDPFGNRVCISLSGPDRGTVYFWDHELELERPGYQNLAFVAKNFTEFILMLHE